MDFLKYIWNDKPSLVLIILFIAMGIASVMGNYNGGPLLLIAALSIGHLVIKHNSILKDIDYALRGNWLCQDRVKTMLRSRKRAKTVFEAVIQWVIWISTGLLLVYIIVKMFTGDL